LQIQSSSFLGITKSIVFSGAANLITFIKFVGGGIPKRYFFAFSIKVIILQNKKSREKADLLQRGYAAGDLLKSVPL